MTINAALVQYSYLQVLDFLTTVVFLLNGVQEGNPLVRGCMAVAGSPLGGLVLVKGAALCLGLFCWRSGRLRMLSKANLFFAALILWNLFALIVSAAVR